MSTLEHLDGMVTEKKKHCDALMNIIHYITELDIMLTNAYVAKNIITVNLH